MTDITDDDQAKLRLLRQGRRIAVVGASPNPERDSNRIFAYLRKQGYDVLPVHPKAEEVHGVQAVPDLEAAKAHWAPKSIDIVDVFRRADAAPEVTDAAVEAGAQAIWYQLGVVHPDAIQRSREAGLDAVVDRCIMVEHRRLVGS